MITDFLQADTNIGKLKVALITAGLVWSKMEMTFLSLDSKIRCISRMI